jgi:hypothetical protein
MNSVEMHLAFRFGMDKLDSLNMPNFLQSEIDLLLNQAQERFIKQRYGINNNKRQSFEETQKRTDDLKELVYNASLTPNPTNSDNKPNGVFVDLPSTVGQEYWFAVNEECEIELVDCHDETITRRVPVRAIQHDDYNKIITDPFEKPYSLEVLRLMLNGQVELISDGSTINTYYLRYIKKPVKITYNTVDCELSEHTHQEIVDMAIALALEGIEARRQQTFNNITNTDE